MLLNYKGVEAIFLVSTLHFKVIVNLQFLKSYQRHPVIYTPHMPKLPHKRTGFQNVFGSRLNVRMHLPLRDIKNAAMFTRELTNAN